MIQILFLILGFVLMELASWCIHKYLMHGPLWFIHKTHHSPSKGFFELNDLFSLIFGGISVVLIIKGAAAFDYRFWLGVGIALYGMVYFVFHDVMIHKRLDLTQKPANRIFQGIAKAHRDHHKTRFKNGAVCFGLLWVPFKYFKNDFNKERR
jgi:beta-carotene 3-hydroxylase